MTKKFGFTLAEVLITLGIIGVVAAMTIPTLIANTNSAKFRSQFKKTLSTMNQAALMGQAQYDIGYSEVKAKCKAAASDSAESDATICGILNDTLSGPKYIENPFDETVKGTDKYKINDGSTDGVTLTDYHAYSLADGSMFAFKEDESYCTKDHKCLGFIDVNGITLPNKEVNGTDCEDLMLKNSTTTTETEEPPSTGYAPGLVPAAYAADTVTKTCIVPNDAAHMTDIYPVYFYNTTVEPATDAARYVLTTSK